MNVSASGLQEQALELADELRDAAQRVFASGWYVLGEEVAQFEQEFARWVGANHAIGVASGTDALELALRGLGVGTGDEVIVPANALPTAYGVAATGAQIRFADARLHDLNIDPIEVERLITPQTRAVIAVHLYGHPADIDAIRDVIGTRDIIVVEDCAQAHGAVWNGRRVGTLGDVAAWSFYPTKNLGAYGDGGAVTTNDEHLATRVRNLRMYGESRRYFSETLGTNSRLDELQAALLRVKLPHLNTWIERRRAVAAIYDDALQGIVETPPADARIQHARHLYPIRVSNRDEMVKALGSKGVPVAVHYPVGAHQQPCFEAWNEGSLPITESLGGQLLSLPMHPYVSDDAAQAIASEVVSNATNLVS